MTKFSTPLHQYKDGDTFIAAQVDGDMLVLGETRNEEAAAEGHYILRAVIPLRDALALAKALLAKQQAADEETWLEEMYQRTLDRQALMDDALANEADVKFWRENAYVAGSVKLEPADMLPY